MENKRWIYAVTGTVILLFAGLVYAWSVIASPLIAYFTEWNKAQISLTFTICMSFFCLGGLIGGILSKKISIRTNLWISGILFLAGFFLASKTNNLTMLYVGYGVLCGFASGFVYNGIMSCVTRWYSDKPGLISGILLMGFGIGSFIIGKVYQAVTPAGVGMEVWRNSFFVFGVLLFIVLVVGGLVVKAPPVEFVPKSLAQVKTSKAINEEGIEAGPGLMLRRPAFWLYFLWSICLSAAGLALISQASGIVVEIDNGVLPGSVATIVGLISIFNGVGRVICGFLFDRIGRRNTMFIVDFTFLIAVCMLIAALLAKSIVIIIIAFVIGGLAYGGITPMNSAFIGAFYGSKNYPVNYPIINMNLLLASFGGTIAGALYDASGSYLSTFFIMIGVVAVATISSVFIKRP